MSVHSTGKIMSKKNFFGILDEVLTSQEHKEVFNHLEKVKWSAQPTLSPDKARLPDTWHLTSAFLNNRLDMPVPDPKTITDFVELHKPINVLYEKTLSLMEQYIGKFKPLRIYGNCKPYGLNSYIHRDDGDYTAIYYPALEWHEGWEGGTIFYEEQTDGFMDAINYVTYIPNRMIVFPGHIPHRGMPCDRICYKQRYLVVMKFQRDVNDPEYAKHFYA
jgi:hypothetical protein